MLLLNLILIIWVLQSQDALFSTLSSFHYSQDVWTCRFHLSPRPLFHQTCKSTYYFGPLRIIFNTESELHGVVLIGRKAQDVLTQDFVLCRGKAEGFQNALPQSRLWLAFNEATCLRDSPVHCMCHESICMTQAHISREAVCSFSGLTRSTPVYFITIIQQGASSPTYSSLTETHCTSLTALYYWRL